MEHKAEEVKVDVNEEADLDKSLEETLSSMKAESTGTPAPSPKAEEEVVTPTTETKAEPTSPAEAVAEPKAPAPHELLVEGFKTPIKGPLESEESYQKRLDLASLVTQLKSAKTPEEKELLSEKISTTRQSLRGLKSPDKNFNNLPNNGSASPESEKKDEDPAKAADLARLRELGGITREELDQTIQQMAFSKEVESTLNSFVARHPELQDEDLRQVYFDHVDANYNWGGKAGKDLMTVLELAHDSMFRPSETITERVLKGAGVQEKVNAMQFPGGTIVKPAVSAEMRKSIDELKSTGMSEEKALELLSDE